MPKNCDKFEIALALFLGLIFVWSGTVPADMDVWKVEIVWPFGVFAALVFTRGLFRFSRLSYGIASIWIAMHAVGAHYTFENVPFGLISELFGFTRNHYDRLAHFAIGLNAFGVAEFVFAKRFVNGAKTAAVFGVFFIMALANFWEIIEWAYAVMDGGDTGAAFLGSQGDIWDAQKDMLSDTLGAVFAAVFFPAFAKKHLAQKTPL